MSYNFSILQNKEIPTALNSLFELIDGTHNTIYEKGLVTRQHKDKYFTEYGFYIDRQNKQANIFIGLWFDVWQTFGIPLCICLDWETPTDEGLTARFEEFVKSRDDVFSRYLSFDEYPTALFDIHYLNNLENNEPLAEIVNEICDFLNIGYKK